MPWWKYVSNRGLTAFENLFLGQNLGEFHSGFRVYRRQVLEAIPFEQLRDDFVFDTQFLVQAVHFGFRLGDIPVPVRYFDEASQINFRRSTKYGIQNANDGRQVLDEQGGTEEQVIEARRHGARTQRGRSFLPFFFSYPLVFPPSHFPPPPLSGSFFPPPFPSPLSPPLPRPLSPSFFFFRVTNSESSLMNSILRAKRRADQG